MFITLCLRKTKEPISAESPKLKLATGKVPISVLMVIIYHKRIMVVKIKNIRLKQMQMEHLYLQNNQ